MLWPVRSGRSFRHDGRSHYLDRRRNRRLMQYGEEPPLIASPNASHPKAHTAARADYDGRRFVTGDQSGRTSAPISPQAVQTILGHKERTGISSGRASAFMTAP